MAVVSSVGYPDHKTLQILRRTYICGLTYRAQRLIVLLQELEDLTPQQKNRLINRYVEIVEELSKRTIVYAVIFHTGRIVVSVGSLIVPALLSIQYTNTTASATPESFSYTIYWATWFISLLVTIFNGILTLFKIDKKYYFLHTTLEQFQSEVWQYIHLTGKYAGHFTKGRPTNHQTQYIYFCHIIEKIKLHQVEEEYFKLVDSSTAADKHTKTDLSGNTVGTAGTKDPKIIAGIYAPTPDQDTLLQHKRALEEATTRPLEKPMERYLRRKSSTVDFTPTFENITVIVDESVPKREVETDKAQQKRGASWTPSNSVSV